MIRPSEVPEVGSEERLARYILQRSHYRPSDQTVKPDAFIPHPHQELSVTRHLSTTEAELWTMGRTVASSTNKTLYGRADVHVSVALSHCLHVNAAPLQDNPNHANILGWPTGKSAQKIIAQELAAVATLVLNID